MLMDEDAVLVTLFYLFFFVTREDSIPDGWRGKRVCGEKTVIVTSP